MKRPSSRFFVTGGITMMMLSLFFVGLFLGLLPDADAVRREGRAALAEVLTVRARSVALRIPNCQRSRQACGCS